MKKILIIVSLLLLVGCSVYPKVPMQMTYLARNTGTFNGSIYTIGTNSSLSDSNALFMVMSDTRPGVPQFLVQNGGDSQASLIVRSFLVVNQNNTLLNMSQNNICGDWGFIHIDCNTSTTGADFGVTDDIEAQGLIYADEGLRAHSTEHGAYLVTGTTGPSSKISSGLNGYFTVNNSYFCDDDANFNMSGWIIIMDEDSDYNQAYGDINAIVNTTCIELKNNPSWDDDFGPVSWTERTSPNMISQSGGFFEYYVGNNEKSTFKVRTKNGTGDASVIIGTDSGVDGYSAFEIDIDANGYSSTGSKITMGSSKNMTEGTLTMLEMVGVATNLNGTDGAYIDMQLVGVPIVAGHFDGIHMPTGLEHLIEVGSADEFDRAYYEGTDITTEMKTGVSTEVFILDNDVVYVGNSGNFTSISFTLDTPSSKKISSTYSYCDSAGVYQPLIINSDTTNGFQQSGMISFDSPIDRGVCNQETDGTPFVDVTDYTYIAITRTRNNIVNPPVLLYINIGGVTTNMYMAEDLLRLHPVNSAPELCSSTNLGAIFFDIDEDAMCVCTSTGWKEMNAAGSNCG